MTFFQEFGADKSISSDRSRWLNNDSMYVRFGGIRNTKTWSKSSPMLSQKLAIVCTSLIFYFQESPEHVAVKRAFDSIGGAEVCVKLI